MPREPFTDNCPGCYQSIPSGLSKCAECGLDFTGLKQATFIGRNRNDLTQQMEGFLEEARVSGDIQIVTIDDRSLQNDPRGGAPPALVGTIHYKKKRALSPSKAEAH